VVSNETLRGWAGLESSDDSQDATLAIIKNGVLRLMERESGRVFRSPPAPFQEILDVPAFLSGGLSYLDATTVQRILLTDTPYAALTGTVTVSAGGTAVTGSGTSFLTELSADPASAITIAGENILISSIESDTALTLAEAHVAGASAVAPTCSLISLENRPTPASDWSELDPRDFELEGRELYTTDLSLFAGRRTLRVRYRLGTVEDQGDALATLVLKDAFKILYQNADLMASDISVDGAFDVSWQSFGDQQKRVRDLVCSLYRGSFVTGSGNGIFLTGESSTWPA